MYHGSLYTRYDQVILSLSLQDRIYSSPLFLRELQTGTNLEDERKPHTSHEADFQLGDTAQESSKRQPPNVLTSNRASTEGFIE